MAARVRGTRMVLKNLNREIGAIKDRTAGGMFAGGLIIQGESMRRVPVEYGNMRASAYTQKVTADGLQIEVGYQAAYAPFVHENLEMVLAGQPRPSGLGEYWGPRGEAKFLENAARDKSDDVVEAVAKRARVRE